MTVPPPQPWSTFSRVQSWKAASPGLVSGDRTWALFLGLPSTYSSRSPASNSLDVCDHRALKVAQWVCACCLVGPPSHRPVPPWACSGLLSCPHTRAATGPCATGACNCLGGSGWEGARSDVSSVDTVGSQGSPATVQPSLRARLRARPGGHPRVARVNCPLAQSRPPGANCIELLACALKMNVAVLRSSFLCDSFVP